MFGGPNTLTRLSLKENSIGESLLPRLMSEGRNRKIMNPNIFQTG